MLPAFIDLEASSLSPDSYPIEVAWSNDDSTIESYLISPRDIPAWTDWSYQSQRVHGLTRHDLLTKGRSPQWVADKVSSRLSRRNVYSDNPDFDAMWLARLFDSLNAGLPDIRLSHLDCLLIDLLDKHGTNRIKSFATVHRAKSLARMRVKARHRAAVDVGYLLEAWQLVQQFAESADLE